MQSVTVGFCECGICAGLLEDIFQQNLDPKEDQRLGLPKNF
jgi:hypothetical protein